MFGVPVKDPLDGTANESPQTSPKSLRSEVRELQAGLGIGESVAPGTRLADRFDVESKLGEGGMGQVFRAFDDVRQTPVALKILGELGPRSIAQIKREFRTAAGLVHPNLVRLHELFCDRGEWFFTMDLVDGTTLTKILETTTPPKTELLRRVLWQLALALTELHGEGALHGDLKPSNFLITEPDHRVVLLDFGLARPLGPLQDLEVAGTPAYMAPEQALGDVLTEAADWYSFGVVLYEALTGELPMRRPSAARLATAPDDLGRLCWELLALGPESRPSGDQVLSRIGIAAPGHSPSAIPPASRAVLVGRTAELGELEAVYERTLSGVPAVALVHGPSGIGKTALAERFCGRARAGGAFVLGGRCRERESMGYKAVDGLIDDLVALLIDLGPEDAAPLLPKDVADLTVLFPALLGAEVVAIAPRDAFETLDRGLVRQRAIAAFCELLGRLRRRAPVVLWIDDLQWSDGESALLLGRLLGGSEPVPLLFVGSYRSGSPGPLLDTLFHDPAYSLRPAVELALGPLEAADSERLALDLLPPDDPKAAALARSIGRDAAGHPLFIAELAYFAERGQGAVGSSSSPTSTLSELVAARVTALDPVARALLETAAVAAVPLSRAVLRRARGLLPVDIEEALDVLRARRLAKSDGLRDADTVDIHHDRIREIVVAGLDSENRQRCHLAIAQALEMEGEGRQELLAGHFEGAGEFARAGAYFIAGADQARKALAFGHAADLYAKGATLARLTSAERHAIRVRRAEALAFGGQGPAAAEEYLAAAERCAPGEALELRRRAAEQLLLSGHVEPGLVAIERVLRALDMPRTRSGPRALAAILVGRLLVRARGLRHVPRMEHEIASDELARVDASWTVACSLSLVDLLRGADFQNRHLFLALRAGEPTRLLRALTLEVSHAATPGVGSEQRTARVLALADDLAKRSGDADAGSLLCLARGIAAYLQGHTEGALGHCEEALSNLTRHRSGAVWEMVTAQRFAIASLFFLGRFRRLAEFVPPLLAEAEGVGNRYATMCFRAAYSTAAWLVRDDVDGANKQLGRTREEWKAEGFQLSHYNILLGETYVDFYTGDFERALARLREQWPRLTRAQLLRVGVLRVQLWQLRAASASVVADIAAARGQRARAGELRADARHLSRKLRRDPIKRAASLAALVDATLARAGGDAPQARRHLEYAIRTFHDQGLALFAAAARVGLGDMTEGEPGQRLVRMGLAEFEREGVARPDRMVALLAPGFGAGSAAS